MSKKNPYELRFELLNLAFNILSQGRDGKTEPAPSVDEIISAADKLNDFVSKPERRIFHIDVGNMPSERATDHIQRIQDEITAGRRQRLDEFGTGISCCETGACEANNTPLQQLELDLAVSKNPLASLEDYFLAKGKDAGGCCGGRTDCNGGNDECSCGNDTGC